MSQYHITPYRNNYYGCLPTYIPKDRSRHLVILSGQVVYFIYLSVEGVKESRELLLEACRKVVEWRWKRSTLIMEADYIGDDALV